MPVTSESQSLNGLTVRISVERKTESRVFGRDFVSGGLRDYFDRSGQGYWIIAKCAVPTSNLGEILGEAVKLKLGSYPITMPETFASHLNVLLWEGHSEENEEEIFKALVVKIKETHLIPKPPSKSPRSSREEYRFERPPNRGISLREVERYPREAQDAIRRTYDSSDGRFHPERLKPSMESENKDSVSKPQYGTSAEITLGPKRERI